MTIKFNQKIGILIRNPKLSFRIFKNYCNLIILGKHRLRTVELSLTYKCQLNCTHCYAKSLENKNKKELDFNKLKNAVNQSIDLGAIHFILTGGEPLLHKDILKLTKYITSKQCVVSIVSNAELISEDYVKKLIQAGVKLFEFSLDSIEENEHNKFRNKKGNYNKILNAISIANKQKVSVSISSVLTRDKANINYLNKLKKFSTKNNCNVNICFPTQNGNWNNKDILLSKNQIKNIKPILKKLKFGTCEDNAYMRKGCFAGKEKININIYGDVLPCPYIQKSYGNLSKKPLKDIYLKMSNSNIFKNRNNQFCLPAQDTDFIDLINKK